MPVFSVLAPRPTDVVLGPVQLILRFRPDCRIQKARVTVGGTTSAGMVIVANTFVFLLPPQDVVPVTVHLEVEMGAGRYQTQFALCCLAAAASAPEKPYEFRDARRSGMVLQRHHIYSSGPPNREPDGQTLAYLRSYGRASFLDVGCGTGAYLLALQDGPASAVGLEINSDYVRQARHQGLNVHNFDGIRLPYADCAFDTVYAIEVLEHVHHWQALLDEMLRVASWRVLLTTPNMGILTEMARHGVVPWHILEGTHVNFFTAETWRHIILNKTGLTGVVKTYGPLTVNGDIFDLHLWVCFEKSGAPRA